MEKPWGHIFWDTLYDNNMLILPPMSLTWGLSVGLSKSAPAQIFRTRISRPAAVTPMV